MSLDRRTFLRRAAGYGGLAIVPSLAGLVSACADAEAPTDPTDGLSFDRNDREGRRAYGPLIAATGAPLALPNGFQIRSFGWVGRPMSDGNITPLAHDGMGAFPGPNGTIRLIRNHEDRNGPTAPIAGANAYDARGGGGTVTLEVDAESRELIRDWVSLNGTIVNCAGGPTPWGSWLSCEETTEGSAQGYDREHGYIFEVPASAEGPVDAVPLKEMGRFVHEAVAVDPFSGSVYETEDFGFEAGNPSQPGSGFYRFLPHRPGDLRAGGRLQTLAVRRRPNYDTTRGQRVGRSLPVVWVDVEDPDPANASADPSAVFRQALAHGAAIFQRLEGCWWGNGAVFFHATAGGDAGLGQVWEYRPAGRRDDRDDDRDDDDDDGDGHRQGSAGVLRLIFESSGESELDSPDNITVSPRGSLLICEDGGGTQFLRGLTRGGRIFDFAQNTLNNTEFAGACFSPDGRTLFVNVQGSTRGAAATATPGVTHAIWGPWRRGDL